MWLSEILFFGGMVLNGTYVYDSRIKRRKIILANIDNVCVRLTVIKIRNRTFEKFVDIGCYLTTNVMIPDALVSCGYLLLGSGYCIYRLINFSNVMFNKIIKPQFIIASVGIAASGGRSLHALVYNLFCRSYPIDPRLIAKELQRRKCDTNIVDWTLRNTGIASLVYSFYHHHGAWRMGNLIVIAITAIGILRLTGEICGANEIHRSEHTQVQNLFKTFSAVANSLPYPIEIFWIISSEFIGRMAGNHYCRVATVPFGISILAFPPQGFYNGWSIADTIQDYAMLCYIILMTEGLCQTSVAE